MNGKGVAYLALSAAIALGACSRSTSSQRQQAEVPANPVLELDVTPISAYEAQFRVSTNLPPPVTVVAGLDLADQKPDDVWIGYSEHVVLTGATTTFVLDAAKAEDPLPAASYEAGVSFYPRWGAEGNPAAKAFPELEAVQLVELQASGQTREAAVRRVELQKWVMLNINMNVPWDERFYVNKLGQYQKSKADLSRLHDAYYFPDADVTLLVNRLRGELTLWRLGRATQ